MQLAKRLFDVDIEAADGQAAVWDPTVRFFVVKQGSAPKAHFFLDPYSRPEEKRGGAWMDEVAGQSRLVRPPSPMHTMPSAARKLRPEQYTRTSLYRPSLHRSSLYTGGFLLCSWGPVNRDSTVCMILWFCLLGGWTATQPCA